MSWLEESRDVTCGGTCCVDPGSRCPGALCVQIAFLIGGAVATFFFDDIQLYEADVPSPPPPSPPPPPNFLLWLDGEGGPKGVQKVVRSGAAGAMTADLSSTVAAHTGVYGFEVSRPQLCPAPRRSNAP